MDRNESWLLRAINEILKLDQVKTVWIEEMLLKATNIECKWFVLVGREREWLQQSWCISRRLNRNRNLNSSLGATILKCDKNTARAIEVK